MKSGVYAITTCGTFWDETEYYRNKNNAIEAVKKALFEYEIHDAYGSWAAWKEEDPENFAEVIEEIENCNYFDDIISIHEIETMD